MSVAEKIRHRVRRAPPQSAGHVLTATDAPESMGFKLSPGTNV